MGYEVKVTREMGEKFKRSRVIEAAPDIWRIEGFSGQPFDIELSSPNIYIMCDGDVVLLTDSVVYPFYRERVLDKLREYVRRGINHLILLNSHGHFDHVANNDLIMEAGFREVRFLLAEPEREVIDLDNYREADLKRIRDYYDPSIEPFFKGRYQGIITLADRAEILSLDSRITRKIGDVEVKGWEIGRFLAIHDAAHTPGHVSIYDPKNKLLTTGDLNGEITPLMHTSLDRSIEMADMFSRMARQGYVELAMDCHRNRVFLPEIYKKFGVEILSKAQISDMAGGRDDCFEFFNFWRNYYDQLKHETLAAHSRLGEATVPEIVEELKKSTNPFVKMKVAFAYPNRPSRTGVLVAKVLEEAGALRRKEGGRIVFTPIK